MDYVSEERHTPLVQAALAHAQFETIHPFLDGNGRVGRALIHVVLKPRGLAPRYVPPISLILATNSKDYVAGLTAARYVGEPTYLAAGVGIALWVQTFAAATSRASRDAEMFGHQIDELVRRWRKQAAPIRANSAADLLLSALPAAPVITVATAAKLIGRSVQATNLAVEKLAKAGVLEQTRQVRGKRAYEAAGLLDALVSFERAVATPTAILASRSLSSPSRIVDGRPQRRSPDARGIDHDTPAIVTVTLRALAGAESFEMV